jgi:predicted transcriptional regulator
LVLHRLESIKNGEHGLLEYLLQGKSLRLVTGADRETGVYQSSQKNVTTSINLITHTNQDYHPLFNGKQSLCIPLGDISKLQEKVYEKEVRELAGLIDTEQQKHAQKVLHHLARELKEYHIYNPIIEQVDLSVFFGNNHSELSKYLKLVNLITLLHQQQQHIVLTKTNQQLEVKADYMIQAFQLYQECFVKADKELYFNVESTFIRLKKLLVKKEKENQNFKVKTIRKELGMSPITLAKHIKTLEQYGKIERTGGSNKTGFEYSIIDWNDTSSNTKNYHEVIQELQKIIE